MRTIRPAWKACPFEFQQEAWVRKALAGAMVFVATMGVLTTTARAEPSGGALQQNTIRSITVAGQGDVPIDAKAVALNVTAVDSAQAGFATVFPCGEAVPTASNLNVSKGQTVPNAVIARPDATGKVCVFGSATLDLIVDVAGYFPADSTAQFLQSPSRVLDTRNTTKVLAGTSITLTVAPPAGATAAILNVTATGPKDAGFVTVYPCDQRVPSASNLNFAAGQTTPNLVMAKPSATNTICLFSSSDTNLLADLTGWMTDGFVPNPSPTRLLDTRNGGRLAANVVRPLTVSNAPTGATAAVINVTATAPSAAGFVTVFPCGGPTPTVSNLNFEAGQTTPNLVISGTDAANNVCITSSVDSDIIVDLSGWITTGYKSLAVPVRFDDTRSCNMILYTVDETPGGTRRGEENFTTYSFDPRTGASVVVLASRYSDTRPEFRIYSQPFFGSDCFVYTVEHLAFADASTWVPSEPTLLRINPQTAERTALTSLSKVGGPLYTVVGQDPTNNTLLITTGLSDHESRINRFSLATRQIETIGSMPGWGAVLSFDRRFLYFMVPQANPANSYQLFERNMFTGDDRLVTPTPLYPISRGLISHGGAVYFYNNQNSQDVWISVADGAVYVLAAGFYVGFTFQGYVVITSPDRRTASIYINKDTPPVPIVTATTGPIVRVTPHA
jgi:hypothetical protein